MKRVVFLIICMIMASSLVLAQTIDVSVYLTPVQDVHIVGLNIPAKYNVTITNNGEQDKFNIYNLLGYDIQPSDKFTLMKGGKTNFEMLVYPAENDFRGKYQITYYVHGLESGNQEEKLVFDILEIGSVFDIDVDDVDRSSSALSVLVKNKENINFESLELEFDSDFYKGKETISLEPYGQKRLVFNIPEDSIRGLVAGPYVLRTNVAYEGAESQVENELNFVEEGNIVRSEESSGIFIRKNIHIQRNDGNVVSPVYFTTEKNILSRLFTEFSPSPTSVEREGVSVNYYWEDEILPGESFEVQVTTNWFVPLLLILFVVAVVAIARKFSQKLIYIRKDISYVKVKGGEFALKISLVVQAKSFVERVNVVDRFPSLVQLYGNFGSEKPQKVDEAGRKIQWYFDSLDRGDIRVMSYIVYSKVGVLGKFVLPPASLFYEKGGKLMETFSNRAFFVTDQVQKE
jgi:hypothetical protein